jgi:hypothetical protein
MTKIIIITLFFFNLIACEPIIATSSKENTQQQATFVCLTSQSQCEVNSNYGSFYLHFSQIAQEQGKIKTELPFQLKLTFDGLKETYQIQSISSYLEGKTMFMGKIPVFFHETDTNTMIAESLLANCSEDVMTWQLWVQVEILVGDEVKQQDFFVYFDSKRL